MVVTNLPMLFPLLKAWLKPLIGSGFSSTRGASKHPSGFRTIGGGDGASSVGAGRRRATTSKARVTSSTSFSESEERIVNNVKMQNLEVSVGTVASTHPPSKGIMVSNEFQIVDIVDDKVSHKSGHNVGHPEESW
jgi:hypothetical protein